MSSSIPRNQPNQYTLPNRPVPTTPDVYVTATKVFNPEPPNRGFVLPNRVLPVVIVADKFTKTTTKPRI